MNKPRPRRFSARARAKKLQRSLFLERLEDRIVFANIGYYDMGLQQGDISQESAIIASGNVPVQIFDLSPAELAGIDVLDVQNPNNGGFGAEYITAMPDIEAAVLGGMVLVIHDRYVDDAEMILPNSAGFNIVRDFGDAANIDVLDNSTLVTNGPGGIVDDTTLDGGNSSSHGYALDSSLPVDATLILSTGDPTHVVTFAYGHGAGSVIYSSIPLDFYRQPLPPAAFNDVYAPNVLAFAVDGVDRDLIAVDDFISTPKNVPVSADILANDSDPDGGVFWVSDMGTPSNGSVSEVNGVITYTPGLDFVGRDSFDYEITDDQGHMATATIHIDVVPEILFVDDDQGEAFERFYIDALNLNGREFKEWSVAADGIPSGAYLSSFKAVIWNVGNDTTSPDAGLSPEEQASLSEYLDGGGGAFIVGQDILFNGVTPEFQTDYLKVESFTGDIRGLAAFAGNSGNEIGEDFPNLDFNLPIDFPEDWSDVLRPTPDAAGVFYRNIVNGNEQPFNTISYPGPDFRLVFMAAPFEGITTDGDFQNQRDVLERITVFLLAGANLAPTATDNAYQTQVNVAVSGNVILDQVPDSDPDGDALVADQTPVSDVSNGTLNLFQDGSFDYTPDFGFRGFDTFVYEIRDNNGGFDTATVTIDVGPNTPPVAVDDVASTLEDNAVAGDVLGNDSDPDGDPLTISTHPVVDVQNGVVTLQSNGSYLYTPDPDFFGTDSFTYEARDNVGLTDTATVTITVTPVNDAPAVNKPGDVNIRQDAPQQTVNLNGIVAGGGESQTLTVTATSSNPALIPHPNVSYASPDSTGSLTFTPVAGVHGDSIITVQVTDDGGVANGGVDTYSTTFKVTVDPPTGDWLFFSRKDEGILDGVAFDEQDIIAYDGVQFTKFFDGSPWLDNMVIDAFAFADNQDLLISLVNPGDIDGMAFDDSDVLRFDRANLSWSIYFDGSDVGLTRSGEDIDGLSVTDEGHLLISTNGSTRVSGLQASDEDIIQFIPASLGETTSGAWIMYFDGSDALLSDVSSEDVDAVSVSDNGDIYLSTIGSFHVGAIFGKDEDVVQFTPITTGDNTTGNYQSPLTFDGSVSGFIGDIGALHIALPSPGAPEPALSDDGGGAPQFVALEDSQPAGDDAAAAAVQGRGEGEVNNSGGATGLIVNDGENSVLALQAPALDSGFEWVVDVSQSAEPSDDREMLLEVLAADQGHFGMLDRIFASWDE